MKKTDFESIVNYIENSASMNENDAAIKLNQIISDEFEDVDISEYSNLFYILIAIEIKKVLLNEFSNKIYENIKEYYKNNSIQLGLKIVQWYKTSENIKECIDKIYKQTGHTLKESNINLLELLVKNGSLTDTRKKLADYLLEYVSIVEKFDFEIYKKIFLFGIDDRYNNDFNKYIYKCCEKNNVFKQYLEIQLDSDYKFDEIDKMVAFYERTNSLMVELEDSFDLEFDKLFTIYKENNLRKIIQEKCKKYNIDFLQTETCKSVLYNYIYKYDSQEVIDKELINEYVQKNKDKILVDRIAYEIINEKIIEKNTTSTYDNSYLEKYKSIIDKKEKMTKELEKEFIIDLTRYKYENNIISKEICEYIIYCLLMYNQYKDIFECVLCDYATCVERRNEILDVHNYVEIEEEMISINGLFRTRKNKRKYILINDNLIKSFSKNNIKVIETLFHEIEHLKQQRDIDSENWINNRYKMYIESILSAKIKDYNDINYYCRYNEIEARQAGAIETKKFIDKLNLNWDELYILRVNVSKKALESLNDMIEECKKLLVEADYKYIDKNTKEDIMKIYKTII